MFLGAGLFAFTKLNIEAYPNPAPVILEITAQAAGLSAEEMERYYTIPIEVGLAATPGVDIIRSTSFYGLSFVRVTFNYGVDYYFALTQTAINLQQNVSLPNNVTPQIQATSLVGEIYRYQVAGPPHFGLTNLRTIQDWVVQRRLLTVPGVVQVNTWGGTTKEYDVEVDLHKLDAYNVTLPQVISAIGNANINVGGRTINIGQQSVNIRGVGLMDSGGADDLTQGYKVEDIENVVLAQIERRADLGEGRRQGLGRLRAAARQGRPRPRRRRGRRDRHHEPHAAHQRRGAARASRDREDQQRRQLPPGVKLVPFYDRTTLVARHHQHGPAQPHLRLPADFLHSVDLPRRPAQRHHRRRQHPVRAVLQHHHPGAARRGRQPAVGRRGRFRHHRRCRGDPGREHLSEFPGAAGGQAATAAAISPKDAGAPIRRAPPICDRREPGPTGCGSS